MADLSDRVDTLGRYLDIDGRRQQLAGLQAKRLEPGYWDDPEAAAATEQEISAETDWVEAFDRVLALRDDLEVYREIGDEEGEDTAEMVAEAEAALTKALDALELRGMLAGPDDHRTAILTINSGAGGTDAQDWADMLLRMYTRYAERHGYSPTLLEYQEGEEAGIKSASLRVDGRWAYGYLRAESGVHRLVRISPYDSSARRHTSFSSVWVYPVIDDDIDIEINPADLKIDTYRASGAGGQHVNTTDSAVRITHQPTGIVVASQNDRSQHKNRATAMNMLKARLFEREMAEREAAASGEYQEKSDIGWGHQIRSYVLQPYQMVKDLRTGVQSPTPDDVLDGALDPFISAALAQRVTGEKVEVEDTE